MTCDCNKPRRRCGVIPVRTCCSNPTVVTRTEFYDYKNNMKTDLDAINRDLADKELKITKLDVEKQNKLLAGQNIILTENADKTVTISSTGGGGGGSYTAGDGISIDNNEISVNNTVQRTLTAGTNITIDANNEISADAPVVTLQTADPGEGQALEANHFIGVYNA